MQLHVLQKFMYECEQYCAGGLRVREQSLLIPMAALSDIRERKGKKCLQH